MNKTLPTLLIAATAAFLAVLAPMPSQATDSKDETYEPDKGPNPDKTTHDRYVLVMKEADRRLKNSLAECDKMAAGERAECQRNANDMHDADVARANDFLEKPAD
jgi:hypothetical protein